MSVMVGILPGIISAMLTGISFSVSGPSARVLHAIVRRGANAVPYLLVGALPFEGFVACFIRGYPISVPLLVSTISLCMLLLDAFLSRDLRTDRTSATALMLVLPGFVSGISALFYQTSVADYLSSLVYSLYLCTLFLLLSRGGFSDSGLIGFLWFVLCAGTAVAAVGIYQAVANNLGTFPRLEFPLTNPVTGPQRQYAFGATSTYLRPTSFFAEPSWFAHFQVYTVFSGAMLYGRTKHAVLATALLVINASAIFLAFSFGAYMIFVGSLIAGLVLDDRRYRGRHFLGAMAIVGTTEVLLYAVLPHLTVTIWRDLVQRFQEVAEAGFLLGHPPSSASWNSSMSVRLGTSLIAIDLWMQSPLTFLVGWGVGEYANVVARFYKVTMPFAGTGWASVLIEQGLLGLLSYMLFFLSLLFNVVQAARAERFHWSTDRFAIGSLVVFLVLAGLSGGLGFERSLRFWTVLSMVNLMRISISNENCSREPTSGYREAVAL